LYITNVLKSPSNQSLYPLNLTFDHQNYKFKYLLVEKKMLHALKSLYVTLHPCHIYYAFLWIWKLAPSPLFHETVFGSLQF